MAHHMFLLEVTLEGGKKEIHGLGVGGAPFVTAEDVAHGLEANGHFVNHDPRQKLPKVKRVRILHRTHPIRAQLSAVHTIKKDDLPVFEVDKLANVGHAQEEEKADKAAGNDPSAVAKPVVEIAADDENETPKPTARSADPDADGMEEDAADEAAEKATKKSD